MRARLRRIQQPQRTVTRRQCGACRTPRVSGAFGALFRDLPAMATPGLEPRDTGIFNAVLLHENPPPQVMRRGQYMHLSRYSVQPSNRCTKWGVERGRQEHDQSGGLRRRTARPARCVARSWHVSPCYIWLQLVWFDIDITQSACVTDDAMVSPEDTPTAVHCRGEIP